MHIARRLKDVSTEDRTVAEGFSLVRRSYDSRLLDNCGSLGERHDISVFSDVKGKNRIGIHTLLMRDVFNRRQRRVLGGLGLRSVLTRLLADVPSVSARKTVKIERLRMRREVYNLEGPHYLEAMFDAGSIADIADEIEGIRASLQSWATDGEPEFIWSQKVPLHLGLAATRPLASSELVESVEKTANELLRPPFQLGLTMAQLMLPDPARGPAMPPR